MQMLESVLEHISKEINKGINFEVSILAITPPLESFIKIATLIDGSPQKTRIFYDSTFYSFQILDGNIFLNSRQLKEDSVTFTENIVNNQYKKLKTSLVIPISHEILGSGALLIGSYFECLQKHKNRMLDLNINSIISQSFNEAITPSKKVVIQNSEEIYFKKLFYSSSMPTIIIDNLGNIIMANTEFENFSGYSKSELENRMTIDDFIPTANRDNILTLIHSSIDKKIIIDKPFLRKNFEDRYVNIVIQKISEIEQYTVDFNDITIYNNMQIEIKDKEDVYSTIDKLSKIINNNLDIKHSLSEFIKKINDIFEYDLFAVFLVNQQSSELFIFNYDQSNVLSVKKLDSKMLKDFLLFINKVDNENNLVSELFNILKIPFKINYNSEIFIQFNESNKISGALCMVSELDNAYTKFHKDVINRITSNVAVSLMKNEMFRLQKKSTNKSLHILKIDNILSKNNEIDDIFKNIITLAKNIFKPDKCTIILFENVKISNSRIAKKIEYGIKEKKITLIENFQKYYNIEKDTGIKEKIKSYCVVPIYVNNEPFALLNLYFQTSNKLNKNNREILQILAERASRVLDGAKQYQLIVKTKLYLEQLIEHSADAIIVMDINSNIEFYSNSSESILGYKREEIMGKSFINYIIDGEQIFFTLKHKIQSNDKVKNIEIDVLKKDGTFIPINWSFSKMPDNNDNKINILGIGKDISIQKKIESDLKTRSADLENLIYHVSHNLKTPLVAQEGFISLINDECKHKLDNDSLQYLERIDSNSKYMRRIVNDLLLYCKIRKEDNNRELFSTNELMNSILLDFNHYKTIEFKIVNKLPDITYNMEELKIIFSNLISNSIKYIGSCSNPQIEISCEKNNHKHIFHIKDNGIGIDKKYHNKIFELFFRLNDIKNVSGTGVGLAIVKQIVEKNNGSITVDSATGKGTTVTFTT